jgi:hypothetical protein
VAELAYSYSVGGLVHAGSYRREFETEEEGWEFVRTLKGAHLVVQFNPNKPSESMASETSVEMLLQARAPAPEEPAASNTLESIPRWIRPLLRLFAALSAMGLVLSLWVHPGAVMGHRVAPEAFFWLLHFGIFVVCIPAVFVSLRLVGNTKRKDFWKVVMRDAPEWMRYMVYGFFAYAMINFFLFMLVAPTGKGDTNPPAVVWRGFSGHWMAGYSAALAILYSATRAMSEGQRCMSGHLVSPGSNFCERCGQPIAPFR